jgi:anti-sigma factor RsiW
VTGTESQITSDEKLVAYLDRELDPEERRVVEARLATDPGLTARLERLSAGARPFAVAFDALLDAAPSARLDARLLSALAESETRRAYAGGRGRWLAAIAAALVLFILGGVAGYFLPRLAVRPVEVAADNSPESWRGIVAEYLTLYTSETLADVPDDPALRANELSRVGARLSLDLTGDRVSLPALDLKRAQIFDLRGLPLVQIAYLSPRDGPVAFCIILNGEADAKPEFEQRDGKNIVYWGKGGRGFMLIGKTPRPELETLAASLADRVS